MLKNQRANNQLKAFTINTCMCNTPNFYLFLTLDLITSSNCSIDGNASEIGVICVKVKVLNNA